MQNGLFNALRAMNSLWRHVVDDFVPAAGAASGWRQWLRKLLGWGRLAPAYAPARRRVARLLLAGCLAGTLASAAAAQKKDDLPEPEDVELNSKGLTLTATYYPGTKDRDTVPVLLLHAHKGKRSDFHSLARELQASGCACLAPDLRGHGDSPILDPRTKNKIEPEKLSRDQLASAVIDVETCKSWLLDKNNEGKLNIDKLVVVGAEYGAILSINWSARDWAAPPLAVGKQGQDVKALVLISPRYAINGFTPQEGLRSNAVQHELGIFILANSKETDAKRMERAFRGYRPQEAGSVKKKDPTIFTAYLNTELTGTELLNAKDLQAYKDTPVNTAIVQFIMTKVGKEKLEWRDRKVF